jgi:hypothetical protein
MANSPIQIVLNSTDFLEFWDRQGGGEHKDFYAEMDKEFVEHQTKLTSQISSLKTSLAKNKYSDVSYAKVVLKQSALAKTHRPTGSIFNQQTAPVVGAGDLGELIVEVSPESADKISNKIMQAESYTKWKEKKDGKKVPNPSNVRSEVGAIDDIIPYSAVDKRKFSVEEGLKWLTNPQTGGAYIIELFEEIPPHQDFDNYTTDKQKLFSSFTDGLIKFGNGLVASKILDNERNSPMYGVRLEDSDNKALIQLKPSRSTVKKVDVQKKINLEKGKHSALLKFLDEHPLVKKIVLPPIITKSNDKVGSIKTGASYVPIVKRKDKNYPRIGVIDGGVSPIFKDWIQEKWGLLSPKDREEEHGTFIAGLAIAGNALNGDEICLEDDGCVIIDLDILPKESIWETYYVEPLQFFTELDQAIKTLKAKTGVRIFNFSLNVSEHVSTDNYSIPAKLLDQIAEDNDIIFVISAGNTGPNDDRNEWPSDPLEALKVLASSRNDTIKKPSESYRNISVSALNPPNLKGIVPFALSRYSCRGPGIRIGLKPDLAHVGGSGTTVSPNGHGLFSVDSNGNIVDGCGTSYATPNVSKTLASIENSIEGEVSRESLIALTVHNATVPELFKDRNIKDVAKDLVGFGMPIGSEEIFAGKPSAITLVFANRILPGKRLSFDFSWPSSLMRKGKCYGYARLTVVSTPPFNHRYGAEFVRVNIEGHLRQLQNDGTYKGRLEPLYLPEHPSDMLYEKNLIAHSFKWSPTKVFEKSFPKGVGPSGDWKLEIEYLARDGENVPSVGVPFTAVLTIEDPDGESPVFNDMRQSLQSQGVKLVDIQTAARVTTRI